MEVSILPQRYCDISTAELFTRRKNLQKQKHHTYILLIIYEIQKCKIIKSYTFSQTTVYQRINKRPFAPSVRRSSQETDPNGYISYDAKRMYFVAL